MSIASVDIASPTIGCRTISEPTGSLAICAELLCDVDPCLLFLADGTATVIVADDLGSGLGADVLDEAALCASLRLWNERCDQCSFEFPTKLGPRLGFAVRTSPDANIFGGLASFTDGSRQTLRALRPALKTCGRLVAGAVRTRRRLEAQLAEATKLESLGRLAVGVAHEINTPVQYVGDNVRFFRDAFAGLRPLLTRCLNLREPSVGDARALVRSTERAELEFLLKEMPTAIEQSLEGIYQVTRLVESLAEFSHPGAQKKQGIDVNRVIENAVMVAKNQWKHVAKVVTDLAADLPSLCCRPGELNQVFLNLIVNAAHAVEDQVSRRPGVKGVITLRTRQDGDAVAVDVEDTGCGIPELIRGKVFDSFFTTKAAGRGTGQGLAIARQIVVEGHGGTIGFETEVSRGTTFKVRLPIQSQGDLRTTCGEISDSLC